MCCKRFPLAFCPCRRQKSLVPNELMVRTMEWDREKATQEIKLAHSMIKAK
jgi:hypothetical protein